MDEESAGISIVRLEVYFDEVVFGTREINCAIALRSSSGVLAMSCSFINFSHWLMSASRWSDSYP